MTNKEIERLRKRKSKRKREKKDKDREKKKERETDKGREKETEKLKAIIKQKVGQSGRTTLPELIGIKYVITETPI